LANKPCTSLCKCDGCLNAHSNDIKSQESKMMCTPKTATPITDAKSTSSNMKSRKRITPAPFVSELYSNFTKKYSTKFNSTRRKLKR